MSARRRASERTCTSYGEISPAEHPSHAKRVSDVFNEKLWQKRVCIINTTNALQSKAVHHK